MNKHLKAIIDKSTIVSFDIYDTLLFRSCGKPSTVFEIIAEEIGVDPTEYSACRIEAEKKARETSPEKEICLEDIYEAMPQQKKNDKESLCQLERYIEKNIVYANREMYEVFQYAVKHKRVILVSDMYLDAETIYKSLGNAGINGYSKLYLSSEIGTKKSTGELFEYVIRTENITAKEILHIGDNIKSDCLSAKRRGIKTYLYTRKDKYCSLNKPYLMSAMIENETLNKPDYYSFGYKYLGPALYGYASWIIKQLREQKICKVFFLAREGQLIKKAFDIVKDADDFEEAYIYASRRSLTVPAIATISNVKEFEELRPIYSRVRVSDQFEKVGLSDQNFIDKPWFEKNKDKSFGELTDDVKQEIINDLYNESKTVAADELELLKKYLFQEDFNGKCAIVDLGWNGSMQRSIVEITKYFHMDVDIIGYFLAQRDEYYKNKDYITNHGFLFDYGKVSDKENLLLNSGTNLLEILFTADHATTIKYKEDDGRIVPVLGEYEYDDIYPKIKECQEAALRFLKDYLSRPDTACRIREDNPKCYFNNMYDLLINPSNQILALFGDINYSDLNEKDMYLARKLSLLSISSLLNEFKYSGWKVGFLKRNLKTNRAFSLYCMLRKRFN